MDYRASLVGLLIGVLVGLTGMGGGSLLAPLLILFFGVPAVWAVGTDMAYSTVTKAVGSLVHIQQKHVNFRTALWLACGSVPAILLSIGLIQFLRLHTANLVNGVIIHAIGYTLLLVAVLLVAKPWLMRWLDQRKQQAYKQQLLEGSETQNESQPQAAKDFHPVGLIVVGAVVGFLVGSYLHRERDADTCLSGLSCPTLNSKTTGWHRHFSGFPPGGCRSNWLRNHRNHQVGVGWIALTGFGPRRAHRQPPDQICTRRSYAALAGCRPGDYRLEIDLARYVGEEGGRD